MTDYELLEILKSEQISSEVETASLIETETKPGKLNGREFSHGLENETTALSQEIFKKIQFGKNL